MQGFLKHTKWAFVWAVFVFILCTIPGKHIPRISILELLSFDKFVHSTLFFVLVVLTVKSFIKQTNVIVLHNHPKITAFFICVIYGGCLELLQGQFIQGRAADIFDFVANSVGCAIGVMVYEKTVSIFISPNA